MAQVPIDQSKPLDFTGVELRERHGRTEATCKCGAWLVVSAPNYKGDRCVIRQMNHVAICQHYEEVRKCIMESLSSSS